MTADRVAADIRSDVCARLIREIVDACMTGLSALGGPIK